MFGILRRLRKDDRGATAIEYGLLAALIAVAIIGGVSAVGGNLNSMFNAISSKISAKTPT
ncbi:Flp family type IVb pilin [Azospirillum sp. B510]|uniref:Flp family type IVb pilin n=1 Tax=Azospirillum sp. (strain B510) TaxID=137722 RepID=UPI00031081CB|nr:Flp family type IVb pilin [Azospirillum sp. B510]